MKSNLCCIKLLIFICMRYKIKSKYKILLLVIIVLFAITCVDFIRISRYKTHPTIPKNKIKTEESEIYWDLVNKGKTIDWSRLDGTLSYIKKEYDCADFRLVNLIRIIYEYEENIPKDYKDKIDDVLLNFRYWLDEPGENSMCYWSENHQILFASAEYLIGQKYLDSSFLNSGLTGKQHMEKSKVRILDWLAMRWNYGFTEFYSNVYYKEDIAALINLIDFSEDREIVIKSKIIMDLLFYDVATQSCNNMFISVSGRAYERNRKGGVKSTLGGLTQYYWGDAKEIDAGMMYGLMQTNKYKLPPLLTAIAYDSSSVIIKQTNGLNISELKQEGFYGKDTRSLMMQWGMEAFINPSIIRNSLSHIRKYKMFTNEFLEDFKMLDFSLLDYLHLEPLVIKLLKPQYMGTAIQKANTYTYKIKDFSMYTVQGYHVGDYADQHHVFGLNVKNEFSIFHNHPALEKDIKAKSPNYWVGYGRLPHSVQEKNVNLSIYDIPFKKAFMEKDLLMYTHAYFPKEKFDKILLIDNYIFGKKGNTYCVFIGAKTLNYRTGTNDDIIQKGKRVFWITEASSITQDGSFANFISRIKNNKIQFDENSLSLAYHTKGCNYQLVYNSFFKVDGKIVDISYSRFDSPYIKSERKEKTLKIKLNNESLCLDFENMLREF